MIKRPMRIVVGIDFLVDRLLGINAEENQVDWPKTPPKILLKSVSVY